MDFYEKAEELEDLCKILCEAMTLTEANNPDCTHVKRLSFIIFEKAKDLKKCAFSS